MISRSSISPIGRQRQRQRLFGVSRRYGQEALSKRWSWPCRDGTMAALACCVPTLISPAIAFSLKFHDNDARALWISISRRIQGIRDGVRSSSRWEFRNHSSCGLPRARAGHGGFVTEEEEEEENALASCVEVAMGGSRYLHVMASSMHNVDHGSIIGLTCIPITKGQSSAKELEFPLFLNALAAVPIKIAVEKGGLPYALEELGNLNDLDLQKIYVNSLDDLRKGGDFLVLDEKKGDSFMVASTFPQAIAVALRYRQPFYLKRETLLSANADFVNRMLINPSARDQDGDVEWLAELSKTMRDLVECQMQLQAALASAVELEQYEEALRLKQKLLLYDAQSDRKALHVLQRLRTLYLERMGIFFKL